MTDLDAMSVLISYWGDDGKSVIREIDKSGPINKGFQEYLNQDCIACGGNWGAMLLSGVRELRHDVWDAIPNDMGVFAMTAISAVLTLLGIDLDK